MWFSNDELWGTEPWEPHSTTKEWTLTSGDGTKTVYVQFMDKAGLISQSYSDTVILDTTTPTISITSPPNGSEITSTTVTVTWQGSDATSGISYYEIRLNDGSWVNVGTNLTHTFSGLGDGSHKIDIKATDKAGNTKRDTVNFTVNTSAPFGLSYLEVAAITATIIVATIGTAIYLLKIRKKSYR